jgi:hypothetical protein
MWGCFRHQRTSWFPKSIFMPLCMTFFVSGPLVPEKCHIHFGALAILLLSKNTPRRSQAIVIYLLLSRALDGVDGSVGDTGDLVDGKPPYYCGCCLYLWSTEYRFGKQGLYLEKPNRSPHRCWRCVTGLVSDEKSLSFETNNPHHM